MESFIFIKRRICIFANLLSLFSFLLYPAISHAILNPSVVYCKALGYEFEIEHTSMGDVGICVLPDGQRVNADDFVAGKVALNWSYCVQNGYQAKRIEKSELCQDCCVCILEDGEEVEVTMLMNLNIYETYCGDGTCGTPENFETCPIDCPSGGWDGFCDGVMDGKVDPDCLEGDAPPGKRIINILDFISKSVEEGTLVGSGPAKSAEGRLNALTNMVATAGDFMEIKDMDSTCVQIKDAYNRCDGLKLPPDFVEGSAMETLATMMQELMDDIKCE